MKIDVENATSGFRFSADWQEFTDRERLIVISLAQLVAVFLSICVAICIGILRIPSSNFMWVLCVLAYVNLFSMIGFVEFHWWAIGGGE